MKHDINAKHKYSDTDVINMLNFLIDNIFVQLGDQVFQQSIGIPKLCTLIGEFVFVLIRVRIHAKNNVCPSISLSGI